MKIHPVTVELVHARGRGRDRETDSQTDMTKLIVAFYKLSKAPKTWACPFDKTPQCNIR